MDIAGQFSYKKLTPPPTSILQFSYKIVDPPGANLIQLFTPPQVPIDGCIINSHKNSLNLKEILVKKSWPNSSINKKFPALHTANILHSQKKISRSSCGQATDFIVKTFYIVLNHYFPSASRPNY